MLALGASDDDSPQQAEAKRLLVAVMWVSLPLTSMWVVLNVVQNAPMAGVALASTSVVTVGVLLAVRRRPETFSVAVQFAFLANNLGSFAQTLLFGGLLASGLNMVWAFLGVLGALIVSGYRVAMFWLGAFVVAVGLGVVVPNYWSGLYTLQNAAGIAAANLTTVTVIAFLVLVYFIRQRDRFQSESDDLLLNILPSEVAHRLKGGEAVIADRAENVSILFADLVDSTPLSERLTPTEMVELLNEIFSPFDDLADELGLEKIKTIGDAYMVVGGLPRERADHLEAIAEMALRMRSEVSSHSVADHGSLRMRFGIHTGPVVAGVIGKRKFSYDLWGDTVNTAARMESHGVPGHIQVTAAVRSQLADSYQFEQRGPVEIKGKGMMTTYYLTGRRNPGDPNPRRPTPTTST